MTGQLNHGDVVMSLANASFKKNIKINHCLIIGNISNNATATKCFNNTLSDLSTTFVSSFNFFLFVVGLAVSFSAINALLTIRKKWQRKYQRRRQMKLQQEQQQQQQQQQQQNERSSQQLQPLMLLRQQVQQHQHDQSQTRQEVVKTSCTTENGNLICIQLLTSSVICDVIHSMSCIPLCLFSKKTNEVYTQFNWVDNVFRSIHTFHVLALAINSCKNKHSREKDVNLKEFEKESNTANIPKTLSDDSVFERKPTNCEQSPSSQSIQPFKRSWKLLQAGVLIIILIWCLSTVLGSLSFIVFRMLNYGEHGLAFRISDKFLLIFIFIVSHLFPVITYFIVWFSNRKYNVKKFKKFSKSDENFQCCEESQYKQHAEHLLSSKEDVLVSTRNHSRSSGESSFISNSPTTLMVLNRSAESKKKRTNLSTLTLAGSFNRKNRDFSSTSSSFKKRSSAKYKSQRMSPQLDRHPSLRYSIKRKKSTGLSSLADVERDHHYFHQQQLQQQKFQQQKQLHRGNSNLNVIKPDDAITMKHVASKTSNFLSVESSPTAKNKKYQITGTRENENRSPRSNADVKHFKENHKRSKSKRGHSKNISGPGSGDDSAKSSRSSSKSDRSSDSCRVEGHPSLRYSTRRKSPRSREVLNKLASVEKIALLNRSIEEEMRKIDHNSRLKSSIRYPYSTNSREIIDNSFLSHCDAHDRNRFGGSMKILGNKKRDDDTEIVQQLLQSKGRSRSTRLSFKNNSSSKSHIDPKKASNFERHPSFKYSTKRKQNENSKVKLTASNYLLTKKNPKNILKSPIKNLGSEKIPALDPVKANIIMTRYLETANPEKSKLRRIASFYLNKTFPHIFIHKSRSYSNLNQTLQTSPIKHGSEKCLSKMTNTREAAASSIQLSSEKLDMKANTISPTVNNLLSVSTVDTEAEWKTDKSEKISQSGSFKLKPPRSFKRNQRHSFINEISTESVDNSKDNIDNSQIMANIFSGGCYGREMIRYVIRQISFFSFLLNIPLTLYFFILIFSINSLSKDNFMWAEYFALFKLVCITISYFGCCIRCCIITKGSKTNKELFRNTK